MLHKLLMTNDTHNSFLYLANATTVNLKETCLTFCYNKTSSNSSHQPCSQYFSVHTKQKLRIQINLGCRKLQVSFFFKCHLSNSSFTKIYFNFRTLWNVIWKLYVFVKKHASGRVVPCNKVKVKWQSTVMLYPWLEEYVYQNMKTVPYGQTYTQTN